MSTSDYNVEWEEIEVTNAEPFDYIKKGYAIKINCWFKYIHGGDNSRKSKKYGWVIS